MARVSRDPSVRLQVFVERGLVKSVPTTWQLLQGQLEMAPYVLAPDEGDRERYRGAPLSHPLLRTPVVFSRVGLDHFRIGHGLHAKPISLYRHLNFVFHEGMPAFDLQLIQTVPGGLAELRSYTEAVDQAKTPKFALERRLIDLILPHASSYRAKLLEPGGWIERALAFDYPTGEDVAEFLRPEFTDLVRFVNYCAETFEPNVDPSQLPHLPRHLLGLASRRFVS